MRTEKQDIRLSFDRAAGRYDGLADVQRRIADALLDTISFDGALEGVAVDTGSGTGYLGRGLRARHPRLALLSCDLAPDMASRSPAPAFVGDLENLPLADGSLDVYVSSLAWQWANLPRALAEAARVLRPGGRLWVATLGPRTLEELREAFGHADAHAHVRSFVDAAEIAGVLATPQWHVRGIDSRPFRIYGESVRALIESVRGLGAGVLPARRAGLFGKQAWQRMVHAYERRREAAGLPLSYEAIFIEARRL